MNFLGQSKGASTLLRVNDLLRANCVMFFHQSGGDGQILGSSPLLELRKELLFRPVSSILEEETEQYALVLSFGLVLPEHENSPIRWLVFAYRFE